MSSDNQSWLAQVEEEALEPELPICDPHHHFWHLREQRVQKRYLLEDFLDDTIGIHNIVRTVFVECHAQYRTDGPEQLRPVGETEFVERLANEAAARADEGAPSVDGIVSFADMTLGADVQEVLDAHQQASPERFCGIRHAVAQGSLQEGAPVTPSLLNDDRFREGVRTLARSGFSYDVWLLHPQIPELTGLAQAVPEATIIMDHIGAPLGVGPYQGRKDEVFETWKASVNELARSPGVNVKLGGLGMASYGYGWHERETPPDSQTLAEAMKPYFYHLIERFGVERCMFESNFPVDKLSFSYDVMWNAFKRVAADFSDDEKRALFHDTAARVYNL